MRVARLELIDFRSYQHAVLPLQPGSQVLIGPNGVGKTNILEALHVLAVGASHRVSGDEVLVRTGASEAVLRATTIDAHDREQQVSLALRPGGRNAARLDGATVPRLRDALGRVRVVLFAPEDLALIRGDPADRRRFLDQLLAQRRPAFHAARQDFDRALKQRNALLRQQRAGDPAAAAGLATWTEAVAATGARVVAARLLACHALLEPFAAHAGHLAGDAAAAPARLTYQLSTDRQVPADPSVEELDPQALAAEMRAAMEARADEERERATTLVGPHRDELRIELEAMPARTHASQGEAWTLALALRLAGRDLLREVGEEPVVLLDDVFSELDTQRRERLAAWCAEAEQVLVTAAVDQDVPLPGPRVQVRQGRVEALDSALSDAAVAADSPEGEEHT